RIGVPARSGERADRARLRAPRRRPRIIVIRPQSIPAPKHRNRRPLDWRVGVLVGLAGADMPEEIVIRPTLRGAVTLGPGAGRRDDEQGEEEEKGFHGGGALPTKLGPPE